MLYIAKIPQKSSRLWVKFDCFTLCKTKKFASFTGHLVLVFLTWKTKSLKMSSSYIYKFKFATINWPKKPPRLEYSPKYCSDDWHVEWLCVFVMILCRDTQGVKWTYCRVLEKKSCFKRAQECFCIYFYINIFYRMQEKVGWDLGLIPVF